MSEEELDLVVVGAGLGGLACAYEVASKGYQVAVVERGGLAGAKNLSGGRLYLSPLKDLCPELLKDAPFERNVVSESIVLMGEDSSLSIRLDAPPLAEQSVTVLRARLDEFLAEKVGEKEGLVMGDQPAEGLIKEGERVAGVMVGGEELRAKMVVAADGVLSFMAEEAGLRKKREAKDYAVGFKEIIKLEKEIINDRFNVTQGQGAARLYLGHVTQGLHGGGFIYTNNDTLSVGIVVGIEAIQKWKSEDKIHQLLDSFKERPDVAPLVAGGTTVEYGAHTIPEGGYDALPAPGIPGMLLVGDAAGFVLNLGSTLRGMDMALASGVLAGRSVNDFLAEDKTQTQCLEHYQSALNDSFVIKEMQAHRRAPEILSMERLYGHYPEQIVRLAKDFFEIDNSGAGMSPRAAFGRFRKDVLQGWRGIRDMWRLRRM
jgi:electron transfer flavoprotein-quinone oxidoreductase